MKKIASLIIVFFALVAVNLALNALQTNTPLSSALAQPRFTPAAPEGDVQHSCTSGDPVAIRRGGLRRRSPSTAMRLRSLTAEELTAQQAAQVLRQSGVQFQGPGPRVGATGLVSPQSPSEACQDDAGKPPNGCIREWRWNRHSRFLD